MKKSMFLLSALLLVMSAACNKTETPSEQTKQEGVPMTLTATIGEPSTKVTTTDDAFARKLSFEWEVGDKVSVVSFDADQMLIANNIFTADAAGSTTTFTGVYSGGASAKYIMVYYPALTESYDDSGTTKDRVPAENGYSPFGILYGLYDNYISTRGSNYNLQTTLDSPSHLKNYLIMAGEADKTDIASNKLSVTLKHNTTIFKVNMTLPSTGMTLKYVSLQLKNADDTNSRLASVGWGWAWRTRGLPVGSQDSSVYINLGSTVVSGMGTGLKAAGTSATVYIPFTLYYLQGLVMSGLEEKLTITSGQKFVVDVTTTTGDLSQTLTFTADKDLTPGRLYTINCAPTEP